MNNTKMNKVMKELAKQCDEQGLWNEFMTNAPIIEGLKAAIALSLVKEVTLILDWTHDTEIKLQVMESAK